MYSKVDVYLNNCKTRAYFASFILNKTITKHGRYKKPPKY